MTASIATLPERQKRQVAELVAEGNIDDARILATYYCSQQRNKMTEHKDYYRTRHYLRTVKAGERSSIVDQVRGRIDLFLGSDNLRLSKRSVY